MPSSFVPLHVHSHYSLLKALPKIPDLVARAKAEGCEVLALTDFDNLYGAIEFYKECKAQGIKPIIGLDAHMGGGKRTLLFAENNTGYKNLIALVTKSHLESGNGGGTYGAAPSVPTITPALLAEHREGIIAVDPHATDIALREIFYLNPEDRRAWEVMRAIDSKNSLHGPADEGDLTENDLDFFFPNAAQMRSWFSETQLRATHELALRCNVELDLGTWIFPHFPISEKTTYNDELRRLIGEGLERRDMEETEEVHDRIEYEFKIIADKGYSPYFLVVADLLRFARERGILTTIRGSVAGSLITYILGITTVDPLAYKIPFERFLNPERPKAPDIDMDYADNRRDEVIDYVRQKYGADHVAQIGTFGTMLARGVVRDVARALGHPYGLGDRVAKAIPMGSQGFPMTLERALKENAELAAMYRDEPDVHEIIELGKKIEGCARHISVHAAGVVIAPKPLIEYSPLQLDPKGGKIITQYDMYSIGDEYGGVGLLKFDFLGIRNLAILAHSVELVEATRNLGRGVKIDIENVPLEDTKTFEMLARGETEGVFQLSGSGMTRYLKDLKPSTIHDINAMVALFRPGPMDMIPAYIERKHNPALVSYLDPRMKDFLDFSYGLLVYQDDVLLAAINLAGYSWLEADNLRKAMGKKIPAEMALQKEKLIAGFITNGMPKNKAERLWQLIEPFAAYGFGKAHAASYGKVAYQTAYMKANFPVEYMAAVMTAEAGDIDKIAVMVSEAKRMGITILPPEVNESFGDFTVILGASTDRTDKAAQLAANATVDAIRFGLYSIKNFGRGVADSIIAERKANGPYLSISDFLRRIQNDNLNKKGLEALIQCGALDALAIASSTERGALMANIERLLEFRRENSRDSAQESLFAGISETQDVHLMPAPAATLRERLASEKELLGLYVSGHPLDQFREKLSRRPMTLGQLREQLKPGMSGVAAGIIEDIRVTFTRSGDQMAFIKIADFDGSIEAVVFPKHYSENRHLLAPERCIALKGRLSNRNGELSLVAEALKEL